MFEPEEPRGDEPEFGWIDDLDFEVMDCEEIEIDEGDDDVYDF
jgi:hypothetical protein